MPSPHALEHSGRLWMQLLRSDNASGSPQPPAGCAGSAPWLSARFLTGRGRLHRLERWQTAYPVFALWAAAVVVILPPVFAFG